MKIEVGYFRGFRLAIIAGTLAVLGSVSATTHCQFLGAPPNSLPPVQLSANPQGAAGGGATSSLLPGDVVEVQVYGISQFDYKARIDDAGNVSLPLVGEVRMSGLTVTAAEKQIAERLSSTHMMKSPQVLLHITESPNHFATVSGEVKTPGPVQVYGDRYLLDVISAAGGLTPLSSPLLTIYRRGSQQPVQLQLPADPASAGSRNIPIYAGDSIIVAKLGVVYVLGAFHQQGALPLRNNAPVTLIEAMSLAGGVNYEAAVNKAFILRSGPQGQVEIPFNVADVLRHRVPDQALQNEDIVLIPPSKMKAALKGGAAGVAASLLAGVGYIATR